MVSIPTNQSKFSNEAHADWPDLNIEEIYNEADIIAVVKTENINKKKITANKNQEDEKDVLEAQFTNLKIINLLKGNPSDKTIILNQALDFVENNKKYLMFLTKGEDGYYYEVTGTSILEFTNNKFMSNITGWIYVNILDTNKLSF
ncbi:hypothetical protein ACLIA0_10690 [Bacillaceae bacterium W0354]